MPILQDRCATFVLHATIVQSRLAMLIISKAQMKVFKDHSTEEFVQRTVVFLRENTPDWAVRRTDEAIAEHVRDLIAWGHEVGIRKEINLQKLMYHVIKYKLPIPFNDRVLNVLDGEVSEDRRIKDLIRICKDHG